MTTSLVEPTVPGASELTAEPLAGVPYTWRHTHVAGDELDRVQETADAETVREHGRGGLPCDAVAEPRRVAGPQTAGA